MTILIGSFIIVLAIDSTPEWIVALNNDVCNVGELQAAIISSICSKKPSSNNLSASSSTNCWTLFNDLLVLGKNKIK